VRGGKIWNFDNGMRFDTGKGERNGKRREKWRMYYFPTAGEAIKEALHLVELRRRHGYTITCRQDPVNVSLLRRS